MVVDVVVVTDVVEVVVVVIVVDVVVSPKGSAVVTSDPSSLLYPPHLTSETAVPSTATSFCPQKVHLVHFSSLCFVSDLYSPCGQLLQLRAANLESSLIFCPLLQKGWAAHVSDWCRL